jgi:hypothetical protein
MARPAKNDPRIGKTRGAVVREAAGKAMDAKRTRKRTMRGE